MNDGKHSKVGFKFNIVLFLYLCVCISASSLFEPTNERKVPWDFIYEAFPVLSIVMAFLLTLLILLWGTKLLELFWNKLISSVFKLREINFQEALSIVLVFGIFFASL